MEINQVSYQTQNLGLYMQLYLLMIMKVNHQPKNIIGAQTTLKLIYILQN